MKHSDENIKKLHLIFKRLQLSWTLKRPIKSAACIAAVIMCTACGSTLSKDSASPPEQAIIEFNRLLNMQVDDLDFMGDGYLWKAKYCAFANCDMDFFESEGRTYRTIDHEYWPRVSNTSWSGDMARCGLIPYALIKNDAQLHRHIKYGERVKWKMGDIKNGLSLPDQLDGATRVNYSLDLVHSLYNVREYTTRGKPKFPLLPYSNSTKVDYHAHLRACSIFADIWMYGSQIPSMDKIVQRDFDRVPESPFYAFLQGRINGEWQHIDQICKSPEIFTGDYIRCDGSESCGVAEKVFGCGLYLDKALKQRSK